MVVAVSSSVLAVLLTAVGLSLPWSATASIASGAWINPFPVLKSNPESPISIAVFSSAV